MKLIQHVSLNTNGHNYRRAYTVCKQQFPGIEAGQFCENKPLEINLAESKQTFHSDSQEETHKLNNEEVKFAEFIQPTSNGRWVNIQYEIQINCGMGGTCCSCSNDPKCSVSMFLQPPLIPLYNQVQPPSNWNPTVYKAREFDMPDQVYIPYDPNAYQKPIKYNYGQNAEASEDSDEPVSASGEEDSDESASENMGDIYLK